jgi:hypothetical protein
LHVTGLDPTQVPPWHDEACVHALSSSHPVPFGFAGCEHCPFAGLHVPAMWHSSAAVHVTGFEPVHVPPWHEEACVQALPSSQPVPSGAFGVVHPPVAGLHVPASLHVVAPPHETGLLPVHTPAWQLSVCVQAFWSLHAVPVSFV